MGRNRLIFACIVALLSSCTCAFAQSAEPNGTDWLGFCARSWVDGVLLADALPAEKTDKWRFLDPEQAASQPASAPASRPASRPANPCGGSRPEAPSDDQDDERYLTDEDLAQLHREGIDVTNVERDFGLFSIRYRTLDELRYYHRMEKTRGLPGPRLPGKFDNEILHWMDAEWFQPEGEQEYWRGQGKVRPRPFWLDYRARTYPAVGTSSPGRSFGFTQQEFVARASGTEAWLLGAAKLKARHLLLHQRPRLPETGRLLPAELWDLQAMGMSTWVIPPGVVNIAIGSASDRPFGSKDEIIVDASWLFGPYGFPGSQLNGFFFVNWQNNREYLNEMPMPGGAVRWKEGDWFTLVAGFPSSAVAWRPCDPWELAASYTFPRTLHGRVRWRPAKALQFYGGFDWETQRFLRSGRPRRSDRLWYVEKRLLLGARWDISDAVFVEGEGGWAFDRFWFEGARYEDRAVNRIDVDDGAFLGARIGVRF